MCWSDTHLAVPLGHSTACRAQTLPDLAELVLGLGALECVIQLRFFITPNTLGHDLRTPNTLGHDLRTPNTLGHDLRGRGEGKRAAMSV